MSVQTKMTAIADKIRSLLGLSDAMGLDAMATNLDNANTEVATQEDLIAQIAGVVAEKSSAFPTGNLTITIEYNNGDFGEDSYQFLYISYLTEENGKLVNKELSFADMTQTVGDSVSTNTANIKCIPGLTIYMFGEGWPLPSSTSLSDNVTQCPQFIWNDAFWGYVINNNEPGSITLSYVQ